jgi:hypothetical protein
MGGGPLGRCADSRTSPLSHIPPPCSRVIDLLWALKGSVVSAEVSGLPGLL